MSSCGFLDILNLFKQFAPMSVKHKNAVCSQLPYYLTLAPSVPWLFPNITMTIKGKHFELIQDSKAVTTQLRTFMKEDFRTTSENDKNGKCVPSKGK